MRLHILGGVDDEEYADECYALVKQLDIKNLVFTGRVDIVQSVSYTHLDLEKEIRKTIPGKLDIRYQNKMCIRDRY